MQTTTCPSCLLEQPLDPSGRIAVHVTSTLGKRHQLEQNRCPGGAIIFVGITLDQFRPHSAAAPEALYWADDCPHCIPDHAGNHEPHCRFAASGDPT